MTIESKNFRFVDSGAGGGLELWVSRDQASFSDAETKTLRFQNPGLTSRNLRKQQIQLNLVGLNGEKVERIIERVDNTTLEEIDQSYQGFDLDLGAFSLLDARALTYTPSLPEIINDIPLYSEGFSVTYASNIFN